MSAGWLSESGGELMLEVRVTPRSPRQRIDSVRNDRLVVRVNAPPADGEANAAVRKLIAKTLGVAQSRVRIARGETARDKTLAVEGVSLAGAERLLTQAAER